MAAAAVDNLGVLPSLYLLHCTLEVQKQGGMKVEQDGGRARTSGGVFIKLLRESKELPSDAQARSPFFTPTLSLRHAIAALNVLFHSASASHISCVSSGALSRFSAQLVSHWLLALSFDEPGLIDL